MPDDEEVRCDCCSKLAPYYSVREIDDVDTSGFVETLHACHECVEPCSICSLSVVVVDKNECVKCNDIVCAACSCQISAGLTCFRCILPIAQACVGAST